LPEATNNLRDIYKKVADQDGKGQLFCKTSGEHNLKTKKQLIILKTIRGLSSSYAL
jgi:hypothetical protein